MLTCCLVILITLKRKKKEKKTSLKIIVKKLLERSNIYYLLEVLQIKSDSIVQTKIDHPFNQMDA